MNSQTAAINLQQSGQSGHHHAYPSTVTTTITTGNPNDSQRYALQATPTAPIRQHKRPAPQPGNGIGMSNGLNNMMQHRNVPPLHQQQPHQQTQALNQQYAPHMNNVRFCFLLWFV
jgi:c-src tyrosine kinase